MIAHSPQPTRHRLWLGALVALALALPAVPAGAMQSGGSGGTKTDKEKLEDAGYTCERGGIDSIECHKGDSKYLCDNSGKCEHWKGPKAPEKRTAGGSFKNRERYDGSAERSWR